MALGGCIRTAIVRVVVMSIMLLTAGRRSLDASAYPSLRGRVDTPRPDCIFAIPGQTASSALAAGMSGNFRYVEIREST